MKSIGNIATTKSIAVIIKSLLLQISPEKAEQRLFNVHSQLKNGSLFLST